MKEQKWRAIKTHITPKQASVHHMLRFGTRLLSLVSLLILRTTIQIHCDSLVHISCLLTSDIAFIIPRNSWTWSLRMRRHSGEKDVASIIISHNFGYQCYMHNSHFWDDIKLTINLCKGAGAAMHWPSVFLGALSKNANTRAICVFVERTECKSIKTTIVRAKHESF
jgi:hypothetical protein